MITTARTQLRRITDDKFVDLVSKGYTMKEIAEKTGYSFRTLETRFAEIMYEHRAKNKANMVLIAVKKGLIKL